MTTLTEKQKQFCDRLKTITNRDTGVRGLHYDNFTGFFTVRDKDGSFVDDFSDLTEALETLICSVHGFRSVEPDVVWEIIEYLDLTKFCR